MTEEEKNNETSDKQPEEDTSAGQAPESSDAPKPEADQPSEASEEKAEQPAAEAKEDAPKPHADQPAADAEAPKEKAAQPAAKAKADAPASKEKEPAVRGGPPTAVVEKKMQPGTAVVSRRRVLQVGFWVGMGASLAGLAAGGLNYIYPRGVAGFGGTVSVPPTLVPPPGQKVQIPSGRFWLVNLTEEQGGPGLLALWWKCPHLGCVVPWRPNFVWPDPATGAPRQGWFRCPCHGSTYTDAGVLVFGPAPRSMDTMALSVGSDGRVSVDTGNATPGGQDNAGRAVTL